MTAPVSTSAVAGQDRAGACSQIAVSSGNLPGWGELTGEVAERYRLRVEHVGLHRKPRYIAIARRLDVRPYAVVTSDPSELLAALGWGGATAPASGARRAAR